MARSRPRRSPAPSWIRGWTTRELHAVAGKFDHDRTTADLTDRQEWLYDRIVDELEHRHRTAPRLLERCWCRYCVPPFPEAGSKST